jgi:hypothetical protein
MMKTFSSNEELFEAITTLIDRMEQDGHAEAAIDIQSGFACLNGLTDGWALFMESIEHVMTVYGHSLPSEETSELKIILKAVKKAVYR